MTRGITTKAMISIKTPQSGPSNWIWKNFTLVKGHRLPFEVSTYDYSRPASALFWTQVLGLTLHIFLQFLQEVFISYTQVVCYLYSEWHEK